MNCSFYRPFGSSDPISFDVETERPAAETQIRFQPIQPQKTKVILQAWLTSFFFHLKRDKIFREGWKKMASRFFPLDDGYLQSVQNADTLPPLPSDEEGDIHNLKHRVSCPRNHPDTSYYVSKGFQRKKTNQTTYSNLKPRNICFYVYFAPTL